MSFCLGSGQLLSTVKDLYLFDQALYTDKLLNKNSQVLFFTRYGWRFQQYPYGKNSKRILSNVLDGSINGFQSHTHRVPQDSIFIVVLRNVKESVYENQIAVKWASAMVSPILAILYDEPYDLPKKSAAFTLFKELLEDRYAEAQTLYANIKNGQTDSYYLDDDEFTYFEKELNTAGMIERAAQYKMIYTGKEN